MAKPVANIQTMDRAGYKLVLSLEGGQIIPPATVVMAKPVTNVQTLDLVPSFVRDIIGTSSGPQILAPARPSTNFQSIDLVPSSVRDIIGNSSGPQSLAPVVASVGLLPSVPSNPGSMYLRDVVGIDIGGQSPAPVGAFIELPPSVPSNPGSTYLRDVVGIDIQIVPPGRRSPARPVTNIQTIDLGAGYVMEVNGGRTRSSPQLQ